MCIWSPPTFPTGCHFFADILENLAQFIGERERRERKGMSETRQSRPWVGLTHGLGWIGSGWVESFQCLGWVGFTTAKVVKILKAYVNAFKARFDEILLHRAVKFDYTAEVPETDKFCV